MNRKATTGSTRYIPVDIEFSFSDIVSIRKTLYRVDGFNSDVKVEEIPRASCERGCQYVLPASKLSMDPLSGVTRRHDVCCQAVKECVASTGRLERLGQFSQLLSHNGNHRDC